MMDRKKTFDAVQMVQIRDRHDEQTKDRTAEERVAFYREKAEALHESMDDQQTEVST